ncbi:hypothetical protein ACQQ2N_06945 [Dokdonella sp. MW10]|uniref:hypothetical protein n=1 Tax=Dokdonella sp. MW10 TaxID=2992926 RepID=UPI003F8126E4
MGALLLARMHTGQEEFEAVTPEGSDDYEIVYAQGVVLVDTKSTRPSVRPRSEPDDIADLRRLWSRPVRQGVQVLACWLIKERADLTPSVRVSAAALFHASESPWRDASFVVAEPSPLADAAEILSRARGYNPLAAELIAIALAQRVGDLASQNGPLPLERRGSITREEVELIVGRVLVAIDVDRLQALQRTGFLKPVDYTTPLHDAGFYLGVDVQPGHFAAGLAIERHDEATQICAALETSGAVLIRGPSGTGKSGLLWSTVLASRRKRLWFAVNPLVVPNDSDLTAFFEAYDTVPLGFAIDDVGRGGVVAWTQLRQRCRRHGQAVLAGSIRSEDVAVVPSRHALAEYEAKPDQSLAQQLWRRLRDREQTRWAGWAEPWTQSKGLLLEFGHLLTSGDRLASVISDQIRMRLQEGRDAELAILSASALVGAHGGSVSIPALRRHLALDPATTARALERLLSEHLVRLDVTGERLGGLHALRASAIAQSLSDVGHSTLSEQAIAAVRLAEIDGLEKVIGGLVASSTIDHDAAAAAVAHRELGEAKLPGLAAALRGLRAGALVHSVRAWLAAAPRDVFPKKVATTAAMMGLVPNSPFPDERQQRIAEWGQSLHTAVAAQRFPQLLASALISALGEKARGASAGDVVDALDSLARAPLDASQRAQIASAQLELAVFPIQDVVRILDAAECIDPQISRAWVDHAEQDFLQRLVDETAFALPLARERTAYGFVVEGDIFEAITEEGISPNDVLVRHVDAIMRLEPSTVRANVRLVGSAGVRSAHMDAEKNISREHAPPKTAIHFNRRVIDVVAAEVASESWSRYLTDGERLLREGLRALKRLLDSVCVGRVNQQALERLNSAVAGCDDLIAPPEPLILQDDGEIDGRHLTPLQNVVFNGNAELVLRFAKLPNGAGALAGHTSHMVELAEKARAEPWQLVRDGPPAELSELQEVFLKIEHIALEASASGRDPRQRWQASLPRGGGAFSVLAARSRAAMQQRIEARSATLLQTVRSELPQAMLIAPLIQDGLIWSSRFIATFTVHTLDEFLHWVENAQAVGDRLLAAVSDGEDVTFVPIVNGHALVDYSYPLNRGRPGSIVASLMDAAGVASRLGHLSEALMQRLDRPILRHPAEFERGFTAIERVMGLHRYGLGGPERPAAEQEAWRESTTALIEFLPALRGQFRGIERPCVTALAGGLEALLSGEPSGDEENAFSPKEFQLALVELTWNRAWQ